jgi:hypothetical protein
MSPADDSANLLSNPEWLPAHIRGSSLQFARLARDQREGLTFLSDEYIAPLSPETASASLAELRGAPAELAPQYIFHSAFAASTLLTRALDIPGTAVGLKEPEILNELGEGSRAGLLSPGVLEVVVRLLARPFVTGEKVIIKPSNVANVLAPSLLELYAGSNAIFLHAPLARFLRSIADKGLWGRRWVRRLYPVVARDTRFDFGLSAAEQFELTDLQVAALGWLMQHAQATALVEAFPGRVRTLDSEVFLARRAETIAAAAAHFGLALDADQPREIADGPAFATHSKEIGRAFDPEEPLQPKAAIPVVDEEIAMVSQWAKAVGDHAGISPDFPSGSVLVA